MEVTIDISMYPSREEFIPPIEFIARINQFDHLKITTFPTSTVVQGEYDYAIQAVQRLLQTAIKNLIWRFM